jgi:hypothetical protein
MDLLKRVLRPNFGSPADERLVFADPDQWDLYPEASVLASVPYDRRTRWYLTLTQWKGALKRRWRLRRLFRF